MFWDGRTGAKLKNARSLRDVQWQRWSCFYGWPVHGLSENSAESVSSVCRSTNGDILATADESKMIRLFRYPCLRGAQAFSFPTGHGSGSISVCFSFDDNFIISVSKKEPIIFQVSHWHTTYQGIGTNVLCIKVGVLPTARGNRCSARPLRSTQHIPQRS